MPRFSRMGLLLGAAAWIAGAADARASDDKRWRADLSDQLWYEHQCRVVSVSKIKEDGPKVEAVARCSDRRGFKVGKSVGHTFAVKECRAGSGC